MVQVAGKQGYAMVELLVSIVIWAIGVLGLTSLLLISLRSNSSSYLKQLSLQSGYDIVERMRSNRTAAIAGSYNVSNLVATGAPTLPSQPSPNCGNSTCTATQMANYDTWYWLTQTLTQLPNGNGAVATAVSGSNTEVTITMRWDDTPAQNMLGAMGSSTSGNVSRSELILKTLL